MQCDTANRDRRERILVTDDRGSELCTITMCKWDFPVEFVMRSTKKGFEGAPIEVDWFKLAVRMAEEVVVCLETKTPKMVGLGNKNSRSEKKNFDPAQETTLPDASRWLPKPSKYYLPTLNIEEPPRCRKPVAKEKPAPKPARQMDAEERRRELEARRKTYATRTKALGRKENEAERDRGSIHDKLRERVPGVSKQKLPEPTKKHVVTVESAQKPMAAVKERRVTAEIPTEVVKQKIDKPKQVVKVKKAEKIKAVPKAKAPRRPKETLVEFEDCDGDKVIFDNTTGTLNLKINGKIALRNVLFAGTHARHGKIKVQGAVCGSWQHSKFKIFPKHVASAFGKLRDARML